MGGLDLQARFARGRVARLATVAPDGSPHLVPVVFTLLDDVIYTAVDAKPKTTKRLRRLRNIEQHARVSVLVDQYDDDWSQLWWVRADGTATVHHDGAAMATGYETLRAKYPQYQTVALAGPVITIAVEHWASWRA